LVETPIVDLVYEITGFLFASSPQHFKNPWKYWMLVLGQFTFFLVLRLAFSTNLFCGRYLAFTEQFSSELYTSGDEIRKRLFFQMAKSFWPQMEGWVTDISFNSRSFDGIFRSKENQVLFFLPHPSLFFQAQEMKEII